MTPKTLFFICSTFFLFAASSAQNSADQLLDKMSAKIKSSNGMKASFELQVRMPNGKIKDRQKGVLQSKGSSFNIKMGDNEMICDGTTLWNYNTKMKEVQINDYDPDETSISPEKLFNSSFKKDYNYKYAGMRVMNKKAYKVVRLFPKNKDGQFTQVELLINPKTNLIYRGYLTDNGKNVYVYTVRNINLGQNIPSSTFNFSQTAHPGVTVLDLR